MKKADLFGTVRSFIAEYGIDEEDISLSHAVALYLHGVRSIPSVVTVSLTPRGWSKMVLAHNPSPGTTTIELHHNPVKVIVHQIVKGFKSEEILGFKVQSVRSLLVEAKTSGLPHRYTDALKRLI